MPLYPYRCTQCGYRFEKIQHFKSEPEKVCPKCGGVLERTLTAPGLQFKGAGWYVTDYAAKSGGGSEAAPGEASKTETKPETKPATGTAGSESSATTNPAASTSTPSSTQSTKTD